MKTTIAMLTLLLAFSGQGFGNDFWYQQQQIDQRNEAWAREIWERGQREIENHRIQGQIDEIRQRQQDWYFESRRRQWDDFDCE